MFNLALVATLILTISFCEDSISKNYKNPNDSDQWDTQKVPIGEAINAMNMTFSKRCWVAVITRVEKENNYTDMSKWFTYCMHDQYKKAYNKIKDNQSGAL